MRRRLRRYVTRVQVARPTSRLLGGRCLVVPAQASGSVEHYYHFLMAYLYPLVLFVHQSGVRKITVRDCGPLTDWLRLLEHGCDVEIVQPGVMLHRLVREAQGAVILESLDDSATFERGRLRAFIDAFPGVTGVNVPDADHREAIVLDRGPSHSFYTDGGAESFGIGAGDGSAAMRRSLPDAAAICDEVDHHVAARVRDPGWMAPAEQVDAFARAKVLVGQHGAGLANMIWMRPPGLVVEIMPPEIARDVQAWLPDLARALGLDYAVVPQDGMHGDVDARLVAAAVERFLAPG